ncbi:GNAT family N-acetyltransferase [Microbacterium sp. KUDC0406]|uniref:GNAT family N-acetyltransferase n=1 Tax=Microbacterium sp. KUDC0406 TaxID=2909588 RepID=UPI001F24B5F4|nr:GNAT family N-acetyltransferase [Microbacterium sp. KUDC0406]UJP11721.1 GNAT family N-acetyltransferase [Microbacterium sp. KUDC0406]
MHDASGRRYHCSTLRSHAELHAAAELYARVFDYDTPDLQLNTNLLSALARNGGSAVGVHTDDGELVGFAYGFAGRDRAGNDFHYSQAAVVAPGHQGAGVGRLLKSAQRDIALEWGQRRMRWTFDPSLARNAHFNFSTLGAEGIGYEDDYYGRPGTDRIVVEWALDRSGDPYAAERALQPPAFGPDDWGRPVSAGGDAVWLPVPARPAGDAPICSTVRAALRSLVTEGRVLVACTRIDDRTAAHLAVRRLDEEEE